MENRRQQQFTIPGWQNELGSSCLDRTFLDIDFSNKVGSDGKFVQRKMKKQVMLCCQLRVVFVEFKIILCRMTKKCERKWYFCHI